MAILGTTPTNIMTDGPSTLPKECYGVPGSRRWEVTTDPPPRDQNLGETMERYKRLFPDPRTNPRYSELTIGDRFPIENLPLVVVRELVKYLPPMDVIRMANLLDNFRSEVATNQQAFDAKSCPCHTEIIGNQCWRHTKLRTSLFRKYPDLHYGGSGTEEKWRAIHLEQIQVIRHKIDQLRPAAILWGERRFYGGTESWNRRYDRPAGLHQAMLAGDTQALADMFPAGDIEGGVHHITVLHTRQTRVVNNLGIMLLRIAGSNITIHSIRMKGQLEQPLSDALAELLWRQKGAACQIEIEGNQQIDNTTEMPPPRWCTRREAEESGARNRKYGLPPIPHLFHNYFVRAHLPELESKVETWETDMMSATRTGHFFPCVWRVVQPYLRPWKGKPNEGDKQQDTVGEAGEDATMTLRLHNLQPHAVARLGSTDLGPSQNQAGAWWYQRDYNPGDHNRLQGSRRKTPADLLHEVRDGRFCATTYWDFYRISAELGRFFERPAPTLEAGMAPLCTDLRLYISEDEDSDTEYEARIRSNRYRAVTSESEEESDDPEAMSEGDSDTEPGSDTGLQPSDPDSDSGQETEPNSPHSLREGGEMKGEPSKLKRENDSDTEPPSPIPPMEIEEVKGEPSKFKREDDSDTEPPSPIPPMEVEDMKGEPSKLKWEPDSDNEPDPPSPNFEVQEIEGSGDNMEQEPQQEPQPEPSSEEPPSWPWTDPWPEPESPGMEEYYMSSDGVTRNYWFINYGPMQDKEE